MAREYKKDKFSFIGNNGERKDAKNGDIYYKPGWRLKPKFPFLFKVLCFYILQDDVWVEHTK